MVSAKREVYTDGPSFIWVGKAVGGGGWGEVVQNFLYFVFTIPLLMLYRIVKEKKHFQGGREGADKLVFGVGEIQAFPTK